MVPSHDNASANAPDEACQQALTLTFGGVDFRLKPSTDFGSGKVELSRVRDGSINLSLNSFTGTLTVSRTFRANFCIDGNKGDISGAKCGKSDETTEGSVDLIGTTKTSFKDPNGTNESTVTSMLNKNQQLCPPESVVVESPSPRLKKQQNSEQKTNPSSSKRGQRKLNSFFDKESNETKQQVKKKKMESKAQSQNKTSHHFASANTPLSQSSKNSPPNCEMGIENDLPDIFPNLFEPPDVSNSSHSIDRKNKFDLTSSGQSNPRETFCMGDLSQASVGGCTFDSKSITKSNGDDSHGKKAELHPCPRWGHTMNMIDHKRLVLYGGQTFDPSSEVEKLLNDLFVYDIVSGTWSKPVNCHGVPRAWHSSNFIPDRQLLLCFGGDVVDEVSGRMSATENVMVLDTEIMLWYPPSVSGTVPTGRSGHSATMLNNTNELVVFGGVSNGKWLNSVYVLDSNRWIWCLPKISGDAPPPSSYHSGTAIGEDGSSGGPVEVGSRIIFFGGNNGTKCFNSVHVLEAKKNGKWSWSHPKTSGKAPCPRTGHIATLLDDNRTILIYGGWDPNAQDSNGDDLIFGDSFLLDTKSWTWQKGPKPRYVASNNRKANSKTSNDDGCTAPSGGLSRVGHSALLAPGVDGSQVLVFGGRLPENRFAADLQSMVVSNCLVGPGRNTRRNLK